jgi:hypothetical protein
MAARMFNRRFHADCPAVLAAVPGDDEDALGKALDSGAEAVVVDLEETIAPDRRKAARTITAGWFVGIDLAAVPGRADLGPHQRLFQRRLV